METSTQLLQGESEIAYLWRLGNLKTSGIVDLSWTDVTNLVNKAFKDETDYISESSYRKRYAAAKEFYDEIFCKNGEGFNANIEAKHELQKLKQQLRDERTAINKSARDSARLDENFAYLGEQLKEIGRVQFPELTGEYKIDCKNHLIVCLSDLHLGECFESAFGRYDSDIARQRLNEYLDKAIEVADTHKCRNVYVVLLGDLISGFPHLTVQLSNRENFIEQIKMSAEYIASFCFELSKHFEECFVTGVAGNHSRIVQNKENAVKDERADQLSLWIVQQMLSHVDNIIVDTDVLDTTVTEITVSGKTYALTHGDYNEPTDSSMGRLVMMLGHIPFAVLAGHKHNPMFKEINGIKFIQSGSLVGGGNDYCTQKRLTGAPNQTLLVVKPSGIECLYNVELH